MSEAEAPVPQLKSPNEELAALITAKLIEVGLVTQLKQSEVGTKLANGSARQEDWQLWIELAIDQKAKEAHRGLA